VILLSKPRHFGWCELGRPISTIPPNQGGARHFAGELYTLQGIMMRDGKLTTSHPVTECRKHSGSSLDNRGVQSILWKNWILRMSQVNERLLRGNIASRPRLQVLVARLCIL
jgi:hypothetical protein